MNIPTSFKKFPFIPWDPSDLEMCILIMKMIVTVVMMFHISLTIKMIVTVVMIFRIV